MTTDVTPEGRAAGLLDAVAGAIREAVRQDRLASAAFLDAVADGYAVGDPAGAALHGAAAMIREREDLP